MLNAYSHSKEGEYLMAARDIIVGFSRYERSRWRGIGFLWNDHAIAARAGVLVRFWTAYRTHSIYDASDAVETCLRRQRTR